MCSGNGTNFENIVRSCPEIDVVLMVYNKKVCGAVRRANSLGIPSCYIKSKDEDLIIRYFKSQRNKKPFRNHRNQKLILTDNFRAPIQT